MVKEGCALQRGACVVKEHAWQNGGVRGREACMSGDTGNLADGTHPTGMHSCFW